MSGFKFSFIPTETEEASPGLNNVAGENESSRRESDVPELNIVSITTTMSNLKTSPNTWCNDEIELASSKHKKDAANSTATAHHYSLKRIAITEKPFQSNSRSMEMETNQNEHIDKHQDRLSAEKTDLIPGYYEGGLKVWECSIDLCNHLLELIEDVNENDISAALRGGGSTLELGCGHGLPACMILRELRQRSRFEPNLTSQNETDMDLDEDAKTQMNAEGYSTKCNSSRSLVVFTDYNQFVLKDVTLPNIILNCTAYESIDASKPESFSSFHCKSTSTSNRKEDKLYALPLDQCCSIIAGDWMELSRKLKEGTLNDDDSSRSNIPKTGRFDLVLAAETTYTLSSANDTAYLLMNHLKLETGVGFIATKRYYFGVGGGSDAFRDATCKQSLTVDGVLYGLEVNLVQEFNDGKSNIRDLWRVKCTRK